MSAPVYQISTLTRTATLDVFVEEVLRTTYTYSNGEVTLSARNAVDEVGLNKLVDIVFNIRFWKELVQKTLKPSQTPLSPFEEEEKKTLTTVQCHWETDVAVTDALFTEATQTIVFQPRPQLSLKFTDFSSWSDFLIRYYLICAEF